jgi:hypothetical protein
MKTMTKDGDTRIFNDDDDDDDDDDGYQTSHTGLFTPLVCLYVRNRESNEEDDSKMKKKYNNPLHKNVGIRKIGATK